MNMVQAAQSRSVTIHEEFESQVERSWHVEARLETVLMRLAYFAEYPGSTLGCIVKELEEASGYMMMAGDLELFQMTDEGRLVPIHKLQACRLVGSYDAVFHTIQMKGC